MGSYDILAAREFNACENVEMNVVFTPPLRPPAHGCLPKLGICQSHLIPSEGRQPQHIGVQVVAGGDVFYDSKSSFNEV